MLMFESANFDEAVFGDPDNFRIDRNPNSHMAFGFGTHFCLGNQLARIELANMTRRVLQRLPDLRLADESRLPLRPANFVSGLEKMPVVFTPSKAGAGLAPTHPATGRLRITGMYRRAPRNRTIYQISDRLRAGRAVHVPGHQIATTVSTWLAELGAHSPLVEDLARAVHAGDWPAARAIGEYLSVDVTVTA